MEETKVEATEEELPGVERETDGGVGEEVEVNEEEIELVEDGE